MLTWSQLGLHGKPIGALNTNGFYNTLIELTENMVANGFVKAVHQERLLVSNDIESLLTLLHSYETPETTALITTSEI